MDNLFFICLRQVDSKSVIINEDSLSHFLLNMQKIPQNAHQLVQGKTKLMERIR